MTRAETQSRGLSCLPRFAFFLSPTARVLPLSLCFTGFAVAATTPPTAPTKSPAQEEILQLDPFEITGTLIKRAEVEGPAPVKLITRQDIEESGRASFSEMMTDLPEVGYTSYNESAVDPVRGASYLSMRGRVQTLILVDGRRPVFTGTSYSRTGSIVDMNRFPLGMIERVEIMQDCGTIYGSGSMAGVVNIILRKDYNGAEVTTRYGNSFRTDVAEKSFTLLFGTSSQRSNLTVGLTYFGRNALRAADTTFASNGDFTDRYRAKSPTYAGRFFDTRSNIGPQARILLGTVQRNGFNGVSIPGLQQGQTLSVLPGTGGVTLGRLASATPSFTAPAVVGTGGQFNAVAAASFVSPITSLHSYPSNLFNILDLHWLTPEVERVGVNLEGLHKLSPRATGYARLTWQHNRSYRQWEPTPISYATDNGIFVPKTNYWNPFGVDVGFYYRPVELGPCTSTAVTSTATLLVGVRGQLAGTWGWDTGLSYGMDQNRDRLGNRISESLLRANLAKSTPDALNVFGGAGYRNPQATLDSFRVSTEAHGQQILQMWDGRLSGEVFSLPWGAVRAGFFAEARIEKYTQVDDPRAAELDDIIAYPRTSNPTFARRSAEALATELYVPLVKAGEHRWLYNSDLTTAVRFDNYSDGYNSRLKPYFGLRVQPARSLALRVSLAQTFSSPSLPRLYGGAIDKFQTTLPDPRRPQTLTGDPFDGSSTSRLIRDEGDPQMKPGHSRAAQVGFVYDLPGTLLKGLTLSATWYRLENTGDLGSTSNYMEILTEELGITAGMVVREPGTETYTNNTSAPIAILSGPSGATTAVAPGQSVTVPGRIRYLRYHFLTFGHSRTEGWDLSLAYNRTIEPLGRIRLNSTLTYLAFYGSDAQSVPLQNIVGRDYFPRVRMSSSLAWSRGRWGANFRNTYVGPWGDLNRGTRVEVDPYSTYDGSVSYSFGRDSARRPAGPRLTVGVDNAFDRDPSLYYYTNLGYVPAFSRRPVGRFFYTEIKKTY